jgi:SAM-dependent methyltransferase
MQPYETSVNRQYGQPGLGEALLTALQRAGKDVEALTADDLAPFEEIHIRGREATRVLAQQAQLGAGENVLDVGSGIGGPARTLAAEFGCRVTGLDLTENFCRAAEMLTARLGLSDRVQFRQGSALEMPFEAASFDVVWMQHITMNIPDKDRLFREIHRVLRPAGRLALYEILAGPVSPPHFPVPWANDPSLSFLVTPAAFHAALLSAGFRESAWIDATGRCLQWHRARLAARPPGTPSPLGIELILGADYPEKSRNVLRNLEEDRIAVIQAIWEG